MKCRGYGSHGAGLLLVLFLLGGCQATPAEPTVARPGRLLMLGLDGMDYQLVSEMVASGELPNFAQLAAQGGFKPLQTSMPPQSPTAWSDVITGTRWMRHGIFDFIHRDPHHLAPYLSTSKVEPPRRVKLGSLALPLGGGGPQLLRLEKPFWFFLSAAGIESTIIKIPSHFPPRDDGGARVLSGMGTPDLMGTYGTFTLLTDDAKLVKRSFSGGRVVPLTRRTRGHFVGSLDGPANPFSAADDPLRIPVDVQIDRDARGVVLQLGEARRLLPLGKWSPFTGVAFDVGGGMSSLKAIVRIYLKSIRPHVVIYVSPMNIDPRDPALAISSPPAFAGHLAAKAGLFFTQGMPEESKALAGGLLSRDEYLTHAFDVMRRRERLLDAALDEFGSGMLFFYFSSTDQIAHMFYREHDPQHPARTAADDQYKTVIRDVYRRMDRTLARVRARLRAEDALIVMSDHGFNAAGYLFDLNLWLARQGYLALREVPAPGALGHVDWSRTQAYGLGLNALYLNLKGRELHGAVAPRRRDTLLRRIRRGLLALRHPETGRRVVSRVVRPRQVAGGKGPGLRRAPDLIIGYAEGFKVTDGSAIGQVGRQLYAINTNEWSGDHCVDSHIVPGILFANRALRAGELSLRDLAPTVLRYFGVDVPPIMQGKSIFSDLVPAKLRIQGGDHGEG